MVIVDCSGNFSSPPPPKKKEGKVNLKVCLIANRHSNHEKRMGQNLCNEGAFLFFSRFQSETCYESYKIN